MAEIMLDEWRNRIEELGEGEFRRRLKVTLVKVGANMVASAKKNASGKPEARSGRLRSSIKSSVVDEAGMPQVWLMAGGPTSRGRVVYAGIQEYGGEIRPKAADFLRIPLGPSLTGDAKKDRFGGSLRSYPGEGFFPFRSSSGKLFIGKLGDEISPGVPRAWYRLVKKVTVPRTLFLGRALAEAAGKLQPQLSDLFRVSLAFERQEVT